MADGSMTRRHRDEKRRNMDLLFFLSRMLNKRVGSCEKLQAGDGSFGCKLVGSRHLLKQ